MRLERADYFELTRAADRIQLARLALAEAQRHYRAVAQRVGLNPDVTYTCHDPTCEVSEYPDTMAPGSGHSSSASAPVA